MSDKFEPKIIAFICTWCGYPSDNLAGVNKIQYPANIRVVRVMCSGSVEPGVIMDAFEHGADGVIVIGCLIDNCHYVSGNKKAQERVDALKKLFDLVGLDSRRLRTEWINASERTKFAKTVTEFVEEVRALGPLPLPKKLAKKPRSKEKTVAAVKELIDDTGTSGPIVPPASPNVEHGVLRSLALPTYSIRTMSPGEAIGWSIARRPS